jgi:hypothetical protein
MWYVVRTYIDDIFRSDFLKSFMQFQHHNITSDKWSDQNNERFYHVKQTIENVNYDLIEYWLETRPITN